MNRALTRNRPEVFLLAALLALAVIAAWRGLQPAAGTAEMAPAALEAGDARSIARLQERVRQSPDDADAAAALGIALLRRVRETGDPGLYAQAQQALDQALKSDPQHLDALIGQGALALARHHFAEALEWGEQARAVAPRRAAVYGVLADAYVELGRYDEAVAAAQQMVDIRPDIDSYSRVSYLRELYGDLPGAIETMAQAAEAGARGAEDTAWALVQLGNLRLAAGDLNGAEATYAEALAGRPGYPHAEAGAARVLAARGRLAEAAARYEAVLTRQPLPEYAVALGDLYEAMGRAEDAARQRDLVRAMQRLSAGAGVDVDLELALFEADHGADPAAAVVQARAAYERRPSVFAADALAWALHKAGDTAEAARYSAASLRLGTRDPALRYRAGMIALAAGDQAAAREHLSIALTGGLSPLRVREAEGVVRETGDRSGETGDRSGETGDRSGKTAA